MDFLELQKNVERRARHIVSPTTIKEVLNRNLRKLVGVFNIPAFHTKINFPTVAAQLLYDLIDADKIRFVTDLRFREDDTTSLDTRLFADRVRSRTVPFLQIIDQSKVVDSAANKEGNVLELFSDPGTRTVANKDAFELFFFRHPEIMKNNTELPEFPLVYHELIALESVVELHEDKFGSSPMENKRKDMRDLYESAMQTPPEEDFPDKDITYSPQFVLSHRPIARRGFFNNF